jgi:RNA polymerase sigma-70 factor (ECF subfamily)
MAENEELLSRFVNGEREAFDEIVRNHKDKVFDTIYSIIGRDSEADDVAQEVFLKVYTKARGFRGGSSLATWIYRITVNACLDHLRKKKRSAEASRELAESGQAFRSSFAQEASAKDNSSPAAAGQGNGLKPSYGDNPGIDDAIQKALDSLPAKYRAIITLKEIDGLSYKEIAHAMKISMDKVKVWLFRARGHLREELSFLNTGGK